MSRPKGVAAAYVPAGEMATAVALLGGDRTFRREIRTALDAHEAIVDGFPGRTLTHLVGQVDALQKADVLEKAVGISIRTLQRRKKDDRVSRLSKEQSGRAWKFAEVLAKAIRVLGSQEEAEEWLGRPAMGLDQQRPIDLLESPAGVEIVESFLERLEYGVYA